MIGNIQNQTRTVLSISMLAVALLRLMVCAAMYTSATNLYCSCGILGFQLQLSFTAITCWCDGAGKAQVWIGLQSGEQLPGAPFSAYIKPAAMYPAMCQVSNTALQHYRLS